MKSRALAGLILTSALLAGCATTGPNRQTDIDALNARVTALQGQLAGKDQEIAALQNQVNDERMAREAAESALRSVPAPAPKNTASDLK
jgi:outer membrane murein-binding lipoprotein Lpp